MSKVNRYVDTKQKTLHRQRRYETMQKKASRARKYYRGEYSDLFGQGGYWVVEGRYRTSYEIANDRKGNTVYIPVVERYEDGLFIVQKSRLNAKPLRKIAARSFRRNKKFDEDSYILKGSLYKKAYELPWQLV